MNGAVVLFLALLMAAVFTACTIALFVRSRVLRRHRVDPKVRSDAPLTWLADPRQPARLHRRIAKVGRTAGAVADDHRLPTKRRRPAEQPPVVSLAEQLRAKAVLLDKELARVSMLPKSARREPIVRLSRSVADMEHACLQIVALSVQVRTPSVLVGQDADITDVASHVQRIARAHEELLRIDRDNGLSPEPTVLLAPDPTVLQAPDPTQAMGTRATGGR